MIRGALFALGLSAGAVSAETSAPSAPLVDTCGGTWMVLSANGEADPAKLGEAAQIVQARIGDVFGYLSEGVILEQDQILLNLSDADPVSRAVLVELVQPFEFGIHDVVALTHSPDEAQLAQGLNVVPSRDVPDEHYIIGAPVVTGADVVSAASASDMNGRPSVQFTLTQRAGEALGRLTEQNVGAQIAVVADGQALTAPKVLSPIFGGRGVIPGGFTSQQTVIFAAKLQNGVLPFALDVTFAEVMDGSDPSADFCP